MCLPSADFSHLSPGWHLPASPCKHCRSNRSGQNRPSAPLPTSASRVIPTSLVRISHTPELSRRRCRAEFRFRESADSESEFRATYHVASDGASLRSVCEKCGLEAQSRSLGHWQEVQRVLSLRGGDVARNSELHITSHQTARVFEEWVRNAGYRGQDPALGHWREVQREFRRKGMLSPGHRLFGSRFRDISPVIAVLAATSETSPRSSPFWQPLPRHHQAHRRFGSHFRDISPVIAILAVPSETSPRSSPFWQPLPRRLSDLRQEKRAWRGKLPSFAKNRVVFRILL